MVATVMRRDVQMRKWKPTVGGGLRRTYRDHWPAEMARRILMTLAGLTLKRRAVGLMPAPSARQAPTRPWTPAGMTGRPMRLPAARARA
jgi:hypothetical protein